MGSNQTLAARLLMSGLPFGSVFGAKAQRAISFDAQRLSFCLAQGVWGKPNALRVRQAADLQEHELEKPCGINGKSMRRFTLCYLPMSYGRDTIITNIC